MYRRKNLDDVSEICRKVYRGGKKSLNLDPWKNAQILRSRKYKCQQEFTI